MRRNISGNAPGRKKEKKKKKSRNKNGRVDLTIPVISPEINTCK